MKATVRKKRTLVSKMGRGVPSVWVDNDEYWPKAINRAVTDLKYSAANAVSMEMPGNIVAIGHRGLSFAAEIPAGYRVIEVHDAAKRDITKESRGGESIRQIFVPKMFVVAGFSAAHTLVTCYAFHIKCDDNLEFSSDEYMHQPLYLTGFQNFWENGKMCNPSTNCIAPYPTLASMLNTTIEAIFGSTFNTDMGSEHGYGLRDATLRNTYSVADMYQKWEAMSPDQVMKMKWTRSDEPSTPIEALWEMSISPHLRRANPSLPMSSSMAYRSVPNSMGEVARSLVAKDK